MKKIILCFVMLNFGLCAFAADDVNKASVKYNVFAPEQKTGAKLNASPIENETCLYYALPTKNLSAYASNIEVPVTKVAVDPYIFKYKNENYIFMFEKGNKMSVENIVGIFDSRNNLLQSLIALDKNYDDKITPEELKKADIRIMKISQKGKLINNKKSDFNINKIDYIDLEELKTITNSTSTGINAHYTIRLKSSNEKITGLVISEQYDILQNLF